MTMIRLMMSLLLVVVLMPVALAQAPVAELRVPEVVVIGEIVTAEVYIQDGVNIAGADVRVEVLGNCLTIESLTPGDFLPSRPEDGGFSPANQVDSQSARFAANITDRTKVANGDGLFLTVTMRAVCADEQASVTISRAELVNDQGMQSSAARSTQTVRVVSEQSAAVIDRSTAAENGTDLLRVAGLGIMLAALAAIVGFLAWLGIRTMQRTNK